MSACHFYQLIKIKLEKELSLNLIQLKEIENFITNFIFCLSQRVESDFPRDYEEKIFFNELYEHLDELLLMGLLGMNMYPIENISIADLWLFLIILRVILKGKIAFGKREIFIAFTFFIALPIFGVLASGE